MKTLVLLSALVLLAFQVQAGPIQDTEEETETDEQPEKEDQGIYTLENGRSLSSLKSRLKKVLGRLLQKTMQKLGVHSWEVRVKIN